MENCSPIIDDFDLVISSLPYHLNFSLAQLCIEKRVPYCDLGGSVPASKQINDLAKQEGSTVFTDLGLAPGWANILAEEALCAAPEAPHTIKMRCGGIPVNITDPNRDPFNYRSTWSPEGLYNEYIDECRVLRDGEIISVPSLSERETVKINGFPPLEAFTTSGGASHTLPGMQERGVGNCSYKTLRYGGHLDLITYFLREKKFNEKQMVSLFTNAFIEDMVIVEVEAIWENLTYRKTKVVYSNKEYTAMQTATAGGLVAAIFASPFAQHGSPLTYADIDMDLFNDNMHILDIY
jgi:saccharopine dehydrogenase-like NADP-dependent oxidoreductase